jgi:(R,R)-butanediol dehydrogenase/meso-butanediol dehydrogenase/diacetyl reductase
LVVEWRAIDGIKTAAGFMPYQMGELQQTMVDPSDTDVAKDIRAATGSGVNVAFEVTGVPQVFAQVIDVTRHEEQALIVSIWETEAAFQPNTIVLSERQITGTIGYRNVYRAVMELMIRGYFQAENLVTKRIELDEIVSEGFEVLSTEKSQVKTLVKAPS